MKKSLKILLIAIGIIIAIIFAMFAMALLRFNHFDFSDEDSWIKDARGVYIKHGNPSQTPDKVKEQQDAVSCAMELYSQFKATGAVFNSQCLGSCQNFAVDIVNVPRTNEDDLIVNQCPDFTDKIVSHFIELDKDGEIVRIV